MKNFPLIFILILLTGCASQSGWTPTVDPYDPNERYQQSYRERAYQNERYRTPQYDPYRQRSRTPEYRSNKSRNYNRDLQQCRELALNASQTLEEAAKGSAVGGLLGAAAGAAIGAITGNAGKGAAIGAVGGVIGGGAKQGIGAEDQYKRAFTNCMRNRGHRVVN